MSRKCSNCGESIADDSLFCPKCGSYTKDNQKPRSFPLKWIAIAGIIIVLAVVAGYAISNHNSKTDTTLVMLSDSNLDSSNQYRVALKDAGNNPLKDKFIVVEFGNNTYKLKTDDNGTASINLTLSDGSHEIKSYYKGDDTYNDAHSSDIIVK